MTPKPVIYIVDDDDGIRTSLTWLLESVGMKAICFGNGHDFLKSVTLDVPACVVLDVRMADMSGFDVQETLNRRAINLPIIFITGHADVPMSVRAFQSGAVDFVEKPYASQQMLEKIQRATRLAIQRYTEDKQRRDLRDKLDSLTPREQAVLKGVLEGYGSKQIAATLCISVKTVDVYRGRIKEKLGVSSTAMLVRDAFSVWSLDTD